MPISTALTFITFVLVCMLGPGFVILRIPLVPNWPYVGWISCGISAAAGVGFLLLMRRHPKPPAPLTKTWLGRVLPLWLAVFSLFWSAVLIMIEENRSLEFAQGEVVEKYRSANHGRLSVRVEVRGRGTLNCEGLSPATWAAITPGSWVAKRCGTTDLAVLTP